MNPELALVLVTTGSGEEAERIASVLVEEMLAACVSIVPGVTSLFRWQGRIQSEPECLLIAKCRLEALAAVTARVQQLHSYEVPEIIALPLAGGSGPYLRWLEQQAGVGRGAQGNAER